MANETESLDCLSQIYGEDVDDVTKNADVFWLLFGTILVFFMQAGFALLEAGSVRAKNTKNILVKVIFTS